MITDKGDLLEPDEHKNGKKTSFCETLEKYIDLNSESSH